MHIYYLRAIINVYNIKVTTIKNKNKRNFNFIIFLLLDLHQSLIEGLKLTSNKLETFISQKNIINLKLTCLS